VQQGSSRPIESRELKQEKKNFEGKKGETRVQTHKLKNHNPYARGTERKKKGEIFTRRGHGRGGERKLRRKLRAITKKKSLCNDKQKKKKKKKKKRITRH